MRRIITFDFDMTLFDHASHSIPESAAAALKKLRQNGDIVVLATGRDMDNYYSNPMLDLFDADARIEQNGAKIVADGKLIRNFLMDKKLLRDMMDYCREKKFGFGFTIGDCDYYVCEEVVREADRKKWGDCERNFRDPEELMKLDVRTALLYAPKKEVQIMEQKFPEAKFRMFDSISSTDVMEQGCSKADGLTILCRYYGVDPKNTFSFGDSMNDYEIIKAAGKGIAMGNSCTELKEAADYVTTDIDRDGIRNGLLHFQLI